MKKISKLNVKIQLGLFALNIHLTRFGSNIFKRCGKNVMQMGPQGIVFGVWLNEF
jgi:hypothetical protein